MDRATADKTSFKVSVLAPEILVSPTLLRLPPGNYFVGDPCYTAGKDAAWASWVRVAQSTSDNFRHDVCGATYDAFPVVGVNTLQGDGIYRGSNGFAYTVDASLIGAVPAELVEQLELNMDVLKNLGTWETFTEEFSLLRDEAGVISIGHISIPTGPSA